jgi:hypothetical protein
MHVLTEYKICPCRFDIHFADGTMIKSAYLAKLPVDTHYRLAIKVDSDAVQVLDIGDDEILAAVDPMKVFFEC